MLRRSIALLFLSAAGWAAAPHGCVGSVAVTTFRLTVQPPGTGPSWIPIRHVNNIPSGYRISYQPVDLPNDLKKDAKLTLVLVPNSSDDSLTVLEPRLAATATEWSAPFAVRLAVLVFAPQGLDEKRLTNLVTKDQNLVAALADYADQTADLEAGIEAANALEQQADDDVNKPIKRTPGEQALFALVRSLNPAVSPYDPLSAGRRVGSATLLGKGAGAFFENAGGIVPGGGVLPMVKSLIMPDTDFRSVYGLAAENDTMTLCAQFMPKSRNKMAYLWVYRMANSGPPATAVAKEADVPMGMRVSVPVRVTNVSDWRSLGKVFDWRLAADGAQPQKVSVRPLIDDRALEIDLRKFAGAPGMYRIEGKWDWGVFKVNGTVRLHQPDDLKSAQVTPESQGKLVAGSGPVAVDLAGADFLFVDHVTVHRPQSAHQIPIDLPTERTGPYDKLPLEIETDGLRPGSYLIALSRLDGNVTDVPFRLLPPHPRIDNFSVNVGDREQTVTLTGAQLDRIEQLTCDRAEFVLRAPSEDGTRREVVVRIQPAAKAGDRVALSAKVEGAAAMIKLPVAMQVAAARPKIREAKISVPRDLAIAPADGEVPAGSWVSFAIRYEPADAAPVLSLQCANPAQTVVAEKLHAGEKHSSAQLAAAGAGALFLSLDPGAVGQSGCALTAVIESDALGKSDAFPLGSVVRLPRIEAFGLTDEKSADGYYGWIRGFDLESIERTGWDARAGTAIAELPRPIAGEGAKQVLRISMPWPSPSPKAPLFIFLRGEAAGRATKISQ